MVSLFVNSEGALIRQLQYTPASLHLNKRLCSYISYKTPISAKSQHINCQRSVKRPCIGVLRWCGCRNHTISQTVWMSTPPPMLVPMQYQLGRKLLAHKMHYVVVLVLYWFPHLRIADWAVMTESHVE